MNCKRQEYLYRKICSFRKKLLYRCFFFNDTATTEIYTLSLHDALPISAPSMRALAMSMRCSACSAGSRPRSEEHTSELQSHSDLVCRLLPEKKKNTKQPVPKSPMITIKPLST